MSQQKYLYVPVCEGSIVDDTISSPLDGVGTSNSSSEK